MATARTNSAWAEEDREAVEVMVAAMENRLRDMISDLLTPTIQRSTCIQQDVEFLKGLVSQHTKGLQDVQVGQFKALEQVATIQSFKEEMTRWDTQRRSHESALDESIQAVQQRLEAYRYNLEQKESALHHLHRNVERAGVELNRLQDAQAELKDVFEGRLDEQSRRQNVAKNETDVRIAGLELRHNALTDELWGEETGLAKAAGELKKTNICVAQLEADMARVQAEKAEKAQLDKLRAEVGKVVAEANKSVNDMKLTVGTVVDDVRQHFRTASEAVAAHNARFVGEVRQEYQGELASSAKLRVEARDFMIQTTSRIASLDERVAAAATKAGALAEEVREEVEELNKKRKKDKNSTDNELKALKKRLGGVFDNSDAVQAGIEHIYAVIKMLLDSELMQSSLELQDSADREKIALWGVREDQASTGSDRAADSPRPDMSGPRAQSAPGGAKPKSSALRFGRPSPGPGSRLAGAGQKDPVVRVHNKCLSCSGQSHLVLSAFKMACLQYSPSPVEHDNQTHDREVLLGERRVLLQTARETMRSGPRGQKAQTAGPTQTDPGDEPRAPTSDDAGLHRRSSLYDALSQYATIDLKAQARSNSGGAAVRSASKHSAQRLPNLPGNGTLTGIAAITPRPVTVR